MKEDEEIQKRNEKMLAMIEGDASEKSKLAKERRQKLLDRIRAKSMPAKQMYYEKAESKLKELQAKKPLVAKPISPECVMSLHVREHSSFIYLSSLHIILFICYICSFCYFHCGSSSMYVYLCASLSF